MSTTEPRFNNEDAKPVEREKMQANHFRFSFQLESTGKCCPINYNRASETVKCKEVISMIKGV